MYRHPTQRVFLQFSGRARIAEGADRDRVYDSAPELERKGDPEKKGVGVIIDLDKVEGLLGFDAEGNRRPLRMTRDHTVSATFVLRPRLTIDSPESELGTVTGPNGLHCPPTCSVTYNPGQTITITATPNPPTSTFGWATPDCRATVPDCTLTMNGDKTERVRFGIVIKCPPFCNGAQMSGTAVRAPLRSGRAGPAGVVRRRRRRS